MRELKFRVYIPDHKIFNYFELGDFHYSDNYLKQHTHPVQQFIGLDDSTGVPIYEGDIVKYDDSLISDRPIVGTAEVIWCNDLTLVDAPQWGLWFISQRSGFLKSMMGEMTIIGNTTQHPELLENQKEL